MNLTLIALEEPTDRFTCLYTNNAFPGHPVKIGRELLSQPLLKGLLINNRISNVECPGGYEVSQRLRGLCESLLPGDGVVFPFSTGIIGWQLPEAEIAQALPALVTQRGLVKALPLARSIMTTDSFPKARSVEVGKGRITGIAKGAGMIEPHLATMLVFVMTDVDVEKVILEECWKEACERSFNCISIDSDQSTSDSAFLFSTARHPFPGRETFQNALNRLARELAEDIVRNGEGTGHVLEVTVSGAASFREARDAGKAIINSPLTKSAVFGNDPNVGRLIQALGDWAGCNGTVLDRDRIIIALGDTILYRNGQFQLDEKKEEHLHQYLKERALPLPSPGFPAHEKNVKILLSLGRGEEEARVWGSDLSCEYVVINAEYRS